MNTLDILLEKLQSLRFDIDIYEGDDDYEAYHIIEKSKIGDYLDFDDCETAIENIKASILFVATIWNDDLTKVIFRKDFMSRKYAIGFARDNPGTVITVEYRDME